MADMINKKMSKRERKAMRKNMGSGCSDYSDYCVDTALDIAIKYDTNYPKHDKNDYTTPMRAYKK